MVAPQYWQQACAELSVDPVMAALIAAYPDTILANRGDPFQTLLREILREARQFDAREYRIVASQSVIDLFLEDESASLAQLGDFIGKPISLQVETSYSQEQYDIILL